METTVCTVGMRPDAQWQESGLKELTRCQYSPFKHHLDPACVALQIWDCNVQRYFLDDTFIALLFAETLKTGMLYSQFSHHLS